MYLEVTLKPKLKEETVHVRLSEAERQALDQVASRHYLNRSEMLRTMIRSTAARLELWPPMPEAHAH